MERGEKEGAHPRANIIRLYRLGVCRFLWKDVRKGNRAWRTAHNAIAVQVTLEKANWMRSRRKPIAQEWKENSNRYSIDTNNNRVAKVSNQTVQ